VDWAALDPEHQTAKEDEEAQEHGIARFLGFLFGDLASDPQDLA
jgi:hypothetical protein